MTKLISRGALDIAAAIENCVVVCLAVISLDDKSKLSVILGATIITPYIVSDAELKLDDNHDIQHLKHML